MSPLSRRAPTQSNIKPSKVIKQNNELNIKQSNGFASNNQMNQTKQSTQSSQVLERSNQDLRNIINSETLPLTTNNNNHSQVAVQASHQQNNSQYKQQYCKGNNKTNTHQEQIRSQSQLSQGSQTNQEDSIENINQRNIQNHKNNDDDDDIVSEAEHLDYFPNIDIPNNQVYLQNSQSYYQQENDDDPELKLLNHIMKAIVSKHDILGAKKGLQYRKFKGQTLNQIEQYAQQMEHKVVSNKSQNQRIDDQDKTKNSEYLSQIQKKISINIDGKRQVLSPKRPQQMLLTIKNANSDLDDILNEKQFLPLEQQASKYFDSNKQNETLEFKRVTKDSLQKQKLERLSQIHQSLLDKERDKNSQTIVLFGKGKRSEHNESAMFSQNSAFGLSFSGDVKSMCGPIKQIKSNVPQTTKAQSIHKRMPSFDSYHEDIMLPILSAQKTPLYTISDLNQDSIKDQKRLLSIPKNSIHKRGLSQEYNYSKKQSSIYGGQSEKDSDDNHFKNQTTVRGFGKQPTLKINFQRQKRNLDREQKEDENKFKQEISYLAERMVL